MGLWNVGSDIRHEVLFRTTSEKYSLFMMSIDIRHEVLFRTTSEKYSLFMMSIDNLSPIVMFGRRQVDIPEAKA